MTAAIIQLMVIQVALPAAFIIALWRKSFHSRLEWLVEALFTVLFVIGLFVRSPWDWLSYYLRYVWMILMIAAIYRSWKKGRVLPFRIKYRRGQKWSLGIYVILLLFLGLNNVWAFSGFTTDDSPIELGFPLKDGTYYVGQGGNSVQINYHNAYPPQKYALDIVKLNGLGMRAGGIYPKELNRYAIYGEALYSPCSGKIIEARHDLPDLIPPEADSGNPEGNYVNIRCDDGNVNVIIAHMQEGSSSVEVGEMVQQGQDIGFVGNSGNTTEPHLHIHAEKDGEGVPIEFDGRFLKRNSLVR
ncbi:M23 family metallopeptidase [Bacillus testis]|uniref:M23 family metallopeptidase n=1 Tax=Bacillus testis TaxID=1622072 RepID=UPI00067EB92B|nr:M23 family metallopeptidase [Bacillus testis]